MSVPPPAPWVARIRKAILWAGFAWPLAVFVMALGPKGAGVWAFIGAAFLAELFIPPALVLSLILPTYKGRIVAVPVVHLHRVQHAPLHAALDRHIHRDHARNSPTFDRQVPVRAVVCKTRLSCTSASDETMRRTP
jgi:hypothetical protein